MATLPFFLYQTHHQKLTLFLEQLSLWNKNTDLVGNSTIDDSWNRHIMNSLQFLAYLGQHDKVILDIGTGAGLPGLVCALCDPERTYILYEKKYQKRVFLKHIISLFKMDNVIIRENFIPEQCPKADILTSRALLGVQDIQPCLKAVKKIVLFKGRHYEQEINNLKTPQEAFKIEVCQAYMDDSVFVICS